MAKTDRRSSRTVSLRQLSFLSVYATFCHQDACPGVHFTSPGLLQLAAVRHQWRATSSPAVGTECRRTVGHRRSSAWPHLTTATATAPASGCSPSASHVQGPRARASVVSWSRAGVVPRWWWLSALSRCTLPSSANDFRLACRPAGSQQVWRQKLLDCRSLWNDFSPKL